MIKFVKDSFRELKHVVWPTKDETKKYFIIVISVLCAVWVYVFLASTIFTNTMFFIKDLIK